MTVVTARYQYSATTFELLLGELISKLIIEASHGNREENIYQLVSDLFWLAGCQGGTYFNYVINTPLVLSMWAEI